MFCMFQVCFVHHFDIFWSWFEHYLDLIWICCGMIWVCFGLDSIRTCVGDVLSISSAMVQTRFLYDSGINLWQKPQTVHWNWKPVLNRTFHKRPSSIERYQNPAHFPHGQHIFASTNKLKCYGPNIFAQSPPHSFSPGSSGHRRLAESSSGSSSSSSATGICPLEVLLQGSDNQQRRT